MELLSIIDRYQSRFEAGYYSKPLTYQHINALHAVQACQSERYGKMMLSCASCDHQQTRFHSCGHRSCPRCQHHDTSRWLERQSQKLLPVEYFMVTFSATAPALLYLLHPCSRPCRMSFARSPGIINP